MYEYNKKIITTCYFLKVCASLSISLSQKQEYLSQVDIDY
jgi:hypothetical protein